MYALDLKVGSTRIVRMYNTAEACVQAARPGCTLIPEVPEEACYDEIRLLKFLDEVPDERKVKL